MAGRLFFETLLPKHGALVSDRFQTNDGKRFWLHMLVRSLTLGHEVGLIDDETKEMIVFDPSRDGRVTDWAQKERDGWGFGPRHPHKRFFIRVGAEAP